MSLAVSRAAILQNVALAVTFPHHVIRGRSRPDPYLSAGRESYIDPSRPISAPKTPIPESVTSTDTRALDPVVELRRPRLDSLLLQTKESAPPQQLPE